jgi:two-component system, chemotaxis family, chemotaxis protein CheY
MKQSISMLVADDSSVIQQIVTDAARRSTLPQLRISLTDNGRDCLTLLRSGDIDLAFIDVQMPELSGMEAFWAARKQGIQTFVTVMSSPPSLEAVDMARKLKAYEFLFKPFEIADVQAIMKTYDRITAFTKVLIVDDSRTARHIIQKVLHGSIFNCEITEAPDGGTAAALCNDAEFDAVFLDCNMPGLTGLDTLERLLARKSDLKVVMISGEHDAVREHQALSSGGFAFLHKPFSSADVDRVMHDIYGLRSPNLRLEHSEPDFDVRVEGSTIRLAHKNSGQVFEYLWFKNPPYLRNGTIRPGPSRDAAPGLVAAAAERSALFQLNSAQLLTAA